LYASDLSMYRQVPIGVVVPRSYEDVMRTVDICREFNAPIFGRGCGTSLAGQCCNTAVVIDFSKYLNKILEINAKKKYAWVEPGLVLDPLREETEKHHLTVGPDPATHEYCTLGGMIGNNACGVHSVTAGRTADNVEELDVLTYDGLRMTVGPTSESELEAIIRKGGRRGEIYAKLKSIRDRFADEIRARFPKIPRRVSGYNLDELLPENGFHVARALVGTESTCAIILRAKMKLVHSPRHRALIIVCFPDMFTAGDHAAAFRELGPIGLECFHHKVIDNEHRKGKEMPGEKLLPEADTYVLLEFGADSKEEASRQARKAMEKIRAMDDTHTAIRLIEDERDQKLIWKVRENGVGASRIPGVEDAWPSWEDAAVPVDQVGNYLRELQKLLDKHGYTMTMFGHIGDGCLHTRITFNVKTVEGVKQYRTFMTEAAHVVTRFGGSLSGEHGDGQARAEFLPVMYGSTIIQAFREFKSAWDPDWKMNPGKVIDPYPMDTNLRVGPDYKPKPVLTVFQFPDDHGSFAEATERCFGVGKCRGLDGGTMCPSFHATRDEMHCTRGRTRMLFEMLRGEVIQDGWKDPHIKEALDLCLSCKGCKGDCPVNVDVATYKAEFLYHYYEGSVRPAAAYSMGQISRWAQIASKMPDLANLLTQTPGLASIMKSLGGVTQRRKMPAFARQTFRSWFAEHRERTKRKHEDRPPVLLWPDTFNNHFFPHTAIAAVEALESAGYRVEVPSRHLCCGRPLYDYGFLDQAKHNLEDILDALAPRITAGVPVVVLEPSCASVFADEMTNILPRNEDAHRLRSQTKLLSKFLVDAKYAPPTLKRKALVHGHCHQKAIFGTSAEEQILAKMGVDVELLDSGCCGLAGSFGFEEHHYDISMKIGERVLLPKLREAARDTLIVSDGFSCREQIMHGTRRHGMHIAEVIQMALHQPLRPPKKYIETGWVQEEPAYPALTAAAGIGLLAAGGLLLLAKNNSTSAT
ncbi:MAG: FAD-binding and (Fe-S)-binding domain-containing protein, partial [Bryobacteraceae bacterium]